MPTACSTEPVAHERGAAVTGHTVGAGTTISAGYIIGAAAGAGFTLTNLGVIGSPGASTGVLVVPGGDSVFNSGKIISSTVTGTGVSLEQGGYVQNASGATISGQQALLASSAAADIVN